MNRDFSKQLRWVRKGAFALTDQALVSASAFVISLLLARWQSAEQYGAYTVAYSVFLLVTGVETALILEPMSVFGPSSYRDSLRPYLGVLVGIHFAVTLALSGVMAAIAFRMGFSSVLGAALLGACVATPTIMFFWLFRRAAYLQSEPHLAASGGLVYIVTSTGLVIFAQRLGWLNSFGAFAVQGIAGVVAGVVITLKLRPGFAGVSAVTPVRRVLSQHWIYGRWATISQFALWLKFGAYFVIVGWMLSIQAVGGLRAIQNFVLPVNQFLVAMTLLLLPWVSARVNREDTLVLRRHVERISLLFVGAATAYSVVLLIFGKWLIALTYAGRYSEFTYLLPWLALNVLLTAAAQGPMIALQAMQLPSEVLIGYSLASAAFLPGLALTRYLGVLGAMLGAILSSVVFLLYVAYRCHTVLKTAQSRSSHALLEPEQESIVVP